MDGRKEAKKPTSEKKLRQGAKLKNETTQAEAMRKKLRTGKKDDSLTKEEKIEKAKLQRQGRKKAYANTQVASTARREICRNEDENTGTDALNFDLDVAESIAGKVVDSVYSGKLYDKKHKRQIAEEKKVKDAGNTGSNAKSKELQKARLKSEMIEARQKKTAKETANSFGNLSRRFVDQAEDLAGKMAESIKEHPKEVAIVLIVILLIMLVCCCFSSCGMMMGGLTNATVQTSYTANDQTIIDVDNDYSALEDALQSQIDNIETTHPGYDEYQYELAAMNHNPYQLAAVLTVLYEDYSRNEVQTKLQELFDSQYTLSTQRVVERRSRQETRTGTRTVTHDDGTTSKETYTYTVTVYYNYYILKVKLTNKTMDTVIRGLGLTDDQMSRYELLLATYGNKRHLFEDDIYSIVDPGDYQDYDIPPEALTDTKFANMIREAEKYLGYPYVWGGSSQNTSFDCSGFVSYVINQCGNGWSVGRQNANGLLSCCTRVSRDEAKPGDLIFFQGTYDVRGASHVGIYVGNGMMIHCGNPIQYASINTNYWQSHFYTFGRIR